MLKRSLANPNRLADIDIADAGLRTLWRGVPRSDHANRDVEQKKAFGFVCYVKMEQKWISPICICMFAIALGPKHFIAIGLV
ncbi:MAG: hypothetical protein WKH97_05370 [Casimicrobiaceae bacterium]